jgi:hypothetical protein
MSTSEFSLLLKNPYSYHTLLLILEFDLWSRPMNQEQKELLRPCKMQTINQPSIPVEPNHGPNPDPLKEFHI